LLEKIGINAPAALIGADERPGSVSAYTDDLAGNRTAVQVSGSVPTFGFTGELQDATGSCDSQRATNGAGLFVLHPSSFVRRTGPRIRPLYYSGGQKD